MNLLKSPCDTSAQIELTMPYYNIPIECYARVLESSLPMP
jgi:hypothetical protein